VPGRIPAATAIHMIPRTTKKIGVRESRFFGPTNTI